ncbi:MAG: hypothetical protein IKB02_04875 [Clostridia bacterium]|nr:hypothetical protein [Clostridia bacterium]
MICNMCPRHETCPDAKNGCEECDIARALQEQRKKYFEQKDIVRNLLNEKASGCEPETKKKRIYTMSDEDIQVEFRTAINQGILEVVSQYYDPNWSISGRPIKGAENHYHCSIDLNKSKKKKLLIYVEFKVT